MRCGARCRVLDGELVCFLDADTEAFSAHFADRACSGRSCASREVSFVKAFYRRPLGAGDAVADGGGRVNHLMARPALALFYPELAGVRQPLAGEVAARRELLERLPFATGYGVEIAMLIDVWREVGLDGIAQVDLDEHRNPHQPLSALDADGRDGARDDRRAPRARRPAARTSRTVPVERPPLASVALAMSATASVPLPLRRPRRHAAGHAAPRCCTTATARSRSTACAPCRRACARTSRSC